MLMVSCAREGKLLKIKLSSIKIANVNYAFQSKPETSFHINAHSTLYIIITIIILRLTN